MSQGTAYRAGLLYLTSSAPGASTPDTVRWRGRYYRYDGTVYQPVSDGTVEANLTRWLAKNPGARTYGKDKVLEVTGALVRDALLAVRAETIVGDDLQPGTWIKGPPDGTVGPFLTTPGGVLDLGRLGEGGAAVVPASPGFFSLAALPVSPDAAAPHKIWMQFLHETFAGDLAPVALLQEIFGYCLWPDCRYEMLALLYGPGNTGKSTAAETLQSLLGDGNVSALPLERFGERFALASLVGKLANIVFDAADVDRTAEGNLKAMVSGEPVTVEQKHQPVGTLRLQAKHILVTNALPQFQDTSDGLWRRLLVLPFEQVCPPDRRDPGLKGRLRDELPAIAHWALQGLARLRRRGRFTDYGRAAALLAEYRRESNPVSSFLGDACVAEAAARVGRKELFDLYRQWAAAAGQPALSVTRFNRAVRALHPQPEGEVRDGRGGDRMFVGLRLRGGEELMGEFRNLAGRSLGGGEP